MTDRLDQNWTDADPIIHDGQFLNEADETYGTLPAASAKADLKAIDGNNSHGKLSTTVSICSGSRLVE